MGAHPRYASMDDHRALSAVPIESRWTARNTYELLSQTAARHGARPALSFQLTGGPTDKAVTYTWADARRAVTQTANAFRALGVGPQDVVALLMPNCPEMAVCLLAGQTAGVVHPINPLLEVGHISALLREVNAKVLVTLAPFPKTDLSAKAAKAVEGAPCVQTILEVDLKRYLPMAKGWLAALARPKYEGAHNAKRLDFASECARHSGDALAFPLTAGPDTISACFHTGGTTGMPKIALHRQFGMIWNGWAADELLFDEHSVLMCPLPLFHVMAAYPLMMSCVSTGGHLVLPTPQGYRGAGVMDNFWKLIARYKATFLCTVPTAVSALMQRKIDADISTVKYALCGSAALPPELFRKFESATGIKLLEGYGQTEATCLISCNPPDGERKIGSVGLPFPYTDVGIFHIDADGRKIKDCATDEIGEICVRGPQVFPGYKDPEKNKKLFVDGEWLRTGDLGRLDSDGYVWITGRAKDLIIRGGHNIDPGMIEDAAMGHPDVAFAGAIGQPDAKAGELPALYVELRQGAKANPEEIKAFVAGRVSERAAAPSHVTIMPELPKTAVGKIFKPDLRREAITRVFGEALAAQGVKAAIRVEEDKKLGLVAIISPEGGAAEAAIKTALDHFSTPWKIG